MTTQQYKFAVSSPDSTYIVVNGAKIVDAHLIACGMEIGEWRKDAAAVPAEVTELVAKFVGETAEVLDFLHGEPLHLGLSPFATFNVVVTAEDKVPSLTLFPARSNPPPGDFTVKVGEKTLKYTRDWCGYQ